jgi:hypothetical protein
MTRYLITALVLFTALSGASTAAAARPNPRPRIPVSVRIQLAELEARLDSQEEARATQADAFDAAATRIEIVNAALVAVIALAGIGAGFLAFKWVGAYTRAQVKNQIDTGIREAGQEVFEETAESLREEYEEKFADSYRRFNQVGGRQ